MNIERNSLFSINKIPNLTKEDILSGYEYGHIMIKPEGLLCMKNDPALKCDFLTYLGDLFEQFDLKVVGVLDDKLDPSVFKEIYKKEINQGIIPDWEVLRFSESNTLNFILKGVDARKKTVLIKGKFCCDKNSCMYDEFDLKKYKNSDRCVLCEKKWGSGCGFRGLIARNGFVFPDIGEDSYTVYNWIHSPDVNEEYAVNAVINAINNNDK